MGLDDDFVDSEHREKELESEVIYSITDDELEQEIKMPIKKIPSISRTNGMGLSLTGKSSLHLATHSHIYTLSYTFFYIPICPLRRYRAYETGQISKWNTTRTSYTFLWELPLTKDQRAHKNFFYLALSLFVVVIVLNLYLL